MEQNEHSEQEKHSEQGEHVEQEEQKERKEHSEQDEHAEQFHLDSNPPITTDTFPSWEQGRRKKRPLLIQLYS